MARPSGRIELRGLRVLAQVGASADERARLQPLNLDLDLELDLSAAAQSDDLSDTADYGAVSAAVAQAVRDRPVALIERVAAVAAQAAFDSSSLVAAVDVTVTKVRPPVPEDLATSGVRVRFERPA